MSHAALIQPHHFSRTAMVYVRQSTPKQLLLHQESTRRQYQLAERAAELGWPQPRIVVLDADPGRSGTSSQDRLGFQRLVSAIGLGEVGLVLVTEVSRLSRRNSDWHRVLELCAVFDTLIADDEGMYDPRDPNDRLVLGLKGTLFAAELHILQARMRSGLLNKARRGALSLRLPVGYRRLHDGTVVLDPDEQVQWTDADPLRPLCEAEECPSPPALLSSGGVAHASVSAGGGGLRAIGLGEADLPDVHPGADQSGLRRHVRLRASRAANLSGRPAHTVGASLA